MSKIWTYNFCGTEYVAWDATHLHQALDQLDQLIGTYPAAWLCDIQCTTWDIHCQLYALGQPSHGEICPPAPRAPQKSSILSVPLP